MNLNTLKLKSRYMLIIQKPIDEKYNKINNQQLKVDYNKYLIHKILLLG